MILLESKFLGQRKSQETMVRKMCYISDKTVAFAELICYKYGNRIQAATYYARGHHVSKNFKIDKEWKVL